MAEEKDQEKAPAKKAAAKKEPVPQGVGADPRGPQPAREFPKLDPVTPAPKSKE